ncbi:MAG: hypothetical protein JJE42_14840, partial [Burkholderiales bacterium]|nr:hypothetical protein [Burkholderiales bacterium]
CIRDRDEALSRPNRIPLGLGLLVHWNVGRQRIHRDCFGLFSNVSAQRTLPSRVDGVLADVIESWLNYSNTIRPKISKHEITDWEFWKKFQINRFDFPFDSFLTSSPFQYERNGFLKDRRLRADGFIIRAQATIRTDGLFRPCRFSQNLRAARANRAFGADTNHPYQNHGSRMTETTN